MKYPALGLALLALACAPRAVDRIPVLDARPAPGQDARLEAGGRTDLPVAPAPTDGPPAKPIPAPPLPDAASPEADAAAPEDAPPPRPDFSSAVAASCAGEDAWESGEPYEAGDTVVHGQPRRKFECRAWPNTPWCGLTDYEPGKNLFYEDAWIDRGACP